MMNTNKYKFHTKKFDASFYIQYVFESEGESPLRLTQAITLEGLYKFKRIRFRSLIFFENE